MSDIVIDLPPPISVNRLRRIDWSATSGTKSWRRKADNLILEAKRRKINRLVWNPDEPIQKFEITLTFDEKERSPDLDNCCKGILDYLCTIEILKDDGPKYMRRLVVEWGDAPTGCRVIVKPLEA